VEKKATLTILDSHLLKTSPLYSLQRTLGCGQAFRWRWEDGRAKGIFAGRPVRVSQEQGGIRVEGLQTGQLAALRHYLALDEPLTAIEETLGGDRILRRILPHTSGIALMRQDPWECLVSFVISAFNNIPKIELTLERLTHRFGAFPSPQALAGARLRDLRSCLLGYRAPYVAEVARRINSDVFSLSELADLPYEEGRKLLLTLPGVGHKVADCVLLFAYGKGEAFPVDVWVKRAVERWYFNGRSATLTQIREAAQARFGTLAGYAQQHLYYYIRKRGTGNGERRRTRR
jgi:N-glycosylase/DNA lyase